MRLDQPFVKLPIRFSGEALAAEVNALPATSWVPHPTGFAGNEAVRLVTPGGQRTDAFEGPMRPTEELKRCPYIMQVMAALGGVWGRSRLMGLAPGSDVPPHVDSHYHWRTHMRIHVPVITNPDVRFTCGGETVHMSAGECWVFDSFRWHEVHNGGKDRRVHLVLDTVVSERLWDLIDAGQSGAVTTPETVQPYPNPGLRLHFEQLNVPKVMSPWEIRGHVDFLAAELLPHPSLELVMKRLDRFINAWAALWAQFGTSEVGIPAYQELAARARREMQLLGAAHIKLKNKMDLEFMLEQFIFIMAVAAPSSAGIGAVSGQRLAS